MAKTIKQTQLIEAIFRHSIQSVIMQSVILENQAAILSILNETDVDIEHKAMLEEINKRLMKYQNDFVAAHTDLPKDLF